MDAHRSSVSQAWESAVAQGGAVANRHRPLTNVTGVLSPEGGTVWKKAGRGISTFLLFFATCWNRFFSKFDWRRRKGPGRAASGCHGTLSTESRVTRGGTPPEPGLSCRCGGVSSCRLGGDHPHTQWWTQHALTEVSGSLLPPGTVPPGRCVLTLACSLRTG